MRLKASKNMSLHKLAVAIGRAHPVSIAPRRTKASAKGSPSRTVFYADVGAAKLTIAQLRSVGAAPIDSRKEGVMGAYPVRLKSFSTPAKTLAKSGRLSGAAVLALVQYRATAARTLRAERPSAARAVIADTLQHLTSSAIRLNRGLPASIAPVGVAALRAVGGANMEQRSSRFVGPASSSQKETQSARPSKVLQNADFQQEISDFLDRQARLPPNGGPGFDRRLTPAWPGLKLPC